MFESNHCVNRVLKIIGLFRMFFDEDFLQFVLNFFPITCNILVIFKP